MYGQRCRNVGAWRRSCAASASDHRGRRFRGRRFLLEEELIRERELRSITDVRLSLTKFFTIIIIVLSLEGIVLVFEVKLDHIEQLIYPTALMAAAILALVGSGCSGG